jgi:hypothetical protein
MRDPAARVRRQTDRIIRELKNPLDDQHFLHSPLAAKWVQRGDLTPYDILDRNTISAHRLPFISLPTEWSDLQFFQAAQLTLRLQQEAEEAGFDLKDASAWNVLFDGGRPVFCDLFSVEVLRSKPWWAAGQFARHFILPLLISRRRGLRAHKTFQAWRDGMPHEVAREMLGLSRFFSRYWPLMAGIGRQVDVGCISPERRLASVSVSQDRIKSFRAGLQQSLSFMLAGVNPAKSSGAPSLWQDYVAQRDHYSQQDLALKQCQLEAWLNEHRPGRILDLGCNSGEFSRLAASSGASVIALDADHGAVQRGVAQGCSGVDYLVAPIDDLRGGYGWQGLEHAGLPERLRKSVDMTLMLALVHHLSIGAGIPISMVAQFAADTSRRWLVVELISPEDPQIRLMRTERNRSDPYPDQQTQLQEFEAAGFVLKQRCELPSSTRAVLLLELAS